MTIRDSCRHGHALLSTPHPHRTRVLVLALAAALAFLAAAGAPAAIAGAAVAAGSARAAAGAEAPAKRPIAETDLFRFVWVADPRLSPDGKRIAFVRVTVDAKREGYETALWIVDADAAGGGAAVPGAAGAVAGSGPRPLTAGPHDLAPRWSPDGRRLAFLRHAGKENQLFVLPLDGGEARQVTDLPGGAAAPAWSPDGAALAFLSTSGDAERGAPRGAKPATEGAAAGAARPGDPSRPGGAADPIPEHESDVRVITRAVYRNNGSGYLDPSRHEHVWTVATPAGTGGGEPPPPRQLTSGEFDEQDPAWAPDGSRLYLISNRTKEPYYEDAGETIYTLPASGGELVKVAAFSGGIASLAVSPDGGQIAFIGAAAGKPVRSYDQPDLWVVAATPGGEPHNLTANYDFDIGAGLSGDQHPPRAGGRATPLWSAGGRALLVPAAERGRVDLRRFDAATGASQPVTAGDHEVVACAATPDGSRLALVISTPTAVGDLFVQDAAGGQPRQLTRFNDPLFTRLVLTPPLVISYPSFDGKAIEAWVQEPPDFQAGKSYPTILDIHGGPHGAYGYTFFHEAQWLAAKGYVVIYPNPRGSTDYGQDFGNVIQYRYPGDDFKDLMAGVDELVRRGIADPKRLGVTGGSGGGLLTNWTITQTDRFAAAVSQRSIADWAGWWYTADFTLFTPRWFRGAPFEDPADFTARSPITYVRNVKTPLMLIEGEADYRTPPTSGGEAMFRALKYLRRPVVMVRFPGESHELSRSGHPWHRVERLQHIERWFAKYLKGERIALYDVP
jgi:dipeptidyl aminopeptidase/acylaminoacyl peptidase